MSLWLLLGHCFSLLICKEKVSLHCIFLLTNSSFFTFSTQNKTMLPPRLGPIPLKSKPRTDSGPPRKNLLNERKLHISKTIKQY